MFNVHKWDISKQCRLRSDAAIRDIIAFLSTQHSLLSVISIRNKIYNKSPKEQLSLTWEQHAQKGFFQTI